MRKIASLVFLLFTAAIACKRAPVTTLDKISQAVLNIETGEIAENEKIDSLGVDSVKYNLSSPRMAYLSIRADIKPEPRTQLIAAEAGWKKYKSGDADAAHNATEINALIRETQEWIERYSWMINDFDSACRHADTSNTLYRVTYLLKGKTNKQAYHSWKEMYITKDALWKADNYDSIRRRMSFIPDPPLK